MESPRTLLPTRCVFCGGTNTVSTGTGRPHEYAIMCCETAVTKHENPAADAQGSTAERWINVPCPGLYVTVIALVRPLTSRLKNAYLADIPADVQTVITDIEKAQTLLLYDFNYNAADHCCEFKPESIQGARNSLTRALAALRAYVSQE